MAGRSASRTPTRCSSRRGGDQAGPGPLLPRRGSGRPPRGRERPTVLKRYPDGAGGEFFYQKRVPSPLPEWLETVTVTFPSGRSAEELCPVDVAHVVWAANLGCLDLNPWAVRRSDVDHPDELRVDLDPQPGVEFSTVRRIALEVKSVLEGNRARRLAEDLRFARGPRVRADRAPLGLPGGAAGGPGDGAGGGAARCPTSPPASGGRRSGAPGVPRLQPERARPDHRLGLLGAGQPRGEGVVSRHLGGAGDGRARRPDHRHGAGPLREARRRRRGIDDRALLARASAGARGARRGRRAWETLRGRPTSRSSGGSRSGCSRARRGRTPRSERRAGDGLAAPSPPLSAAFLAQLVYAEWDGGR